MTEPRFADRTVLGYGTNVHAGTTLDEIKDALETHAAPVRDRCTTGDARLPIGLWIPAPAVEDLRGDRADEFAAWLAERRIRVFTINGFPYGDFHGEVVKHAVYRPVWGDPRRTAYTVDLADTLTMLAGMVGEGGISTLPLGWPTDFESEDDVRHAADELLQVADDLEEIEASTGSYIHLDIEPEPGCCLQTSTDVVEFFDTHLLGRGHDDRVRRYLRVCHDVCHAAVMFEDQASMLARYDALGITIGKVQVSSAVEASFDEDRDATLAALRTFNEQRYLHQTVVNIDGATTLHEDLPVALADAPAEGTWRVHFHVPVFIDRLGPLGTTRDEIDVALRLFRDRTEIRQYEIETYAWDVLPPEHRGPSLADDIARELEYVRERMDEIDTA